MVAYGANSSGELEAPPRPRPARVVTRAHVVRLHHLRLEILRRVFQHRRQHRSKVRRAATLGDVAHERERRSTHAGRVLIRASGDEHLEKRRRVGADERLGARSHPVRHPRQQIDRADDVIRLVRHLGIAQVELALRELRPSEVERAGKHRRGVFLRAESHARDDRRDALEELVQIRLRVAAFLPLSKQWGKKRRRRLGVSNGVPALSASVATASNAHRRFLRWYGRAPAPALRDGRQPRRCPPAPRR